MLLLIAWVRWGSACCRRPMAFPDVNLYSLIKSWKLTSVTATPITRSPQEQGAHDGFPGAERNVRCPPLVVTRTLTGVVQSGERPTQNSHHNFAHHQLPYRTNQSSHGDHVPDQEPPLQMTDAEKFGLPGLMDILRGNISADQSAIALGMDLSNLGLDINRYAACQIPPKSHS